MSTYCECGDVAEVFYDKHGNELNDPCCRECWHFRQMKLEELFGNGTQISAQTNIRRTTHAADKNGGEILDD